MEFRKKDLIDYLILEIDELEPKNECYHFYYYYLLELIEENRQKKLKETLINFKNLLLLKIDKVINLIKNYYNKIYLEIDLDDSEQEDNENEIIDNKDEIINNEIDYKIYFVNTIKKCNLDIINKFIENHKFIVSKQILQKTLKRNIIPVKKKI